MKDDAVFPMKKCRSCGRSLPATPEFFHRNGKHLYTNCKKCETARGKEKRTVIAEDPDKRDKLRAYQAAKKREGRAANTEYAENQRALKRDAYHKQMQDSEWRKSEAVRKGALARRRYHSDPEFRKAENKRTKGWFKRNPEKARDLWATAHDNKLRRAEIDPEYKAKMTHWSRNSHARLVSTPEGRARHRAKAARAFAAMLQATPPWVDADHIARIEAIYTEAARLTEETGEPHEVDHIIPLQSKEVCGLHVWWNLQVLTRFKNRSKGNKFKPDP